MAHNMSKAAAMAPGSRQLLGVQEAKAQNDRKRQRDSPAALEARLSRPQASKAISTAASTVHELSPAEDLKEQGNAALKQGNLPEVILQTSQDVTIAAAA